MGILATIKKDAEDVKSFIQKVAGQAPAAVATILADEQRFAPVIEEFVPGSTAVIEITNILLELAEKAVTSAGAAASANGLSVTLDVATVKAIQAAVAAAKKA